MFFWECFGGRGGGILECASVRVFKTACRVHFVPIVAFRVFYELMFFSGVSAILSARVLCAWSYRRACLRLIFHT